jgi:hypothetical protein
MTVPQQPVAAKYDRYSKRTKLYFDTVDGKYGQDFYVMGSVSWPDGEREGFALLAGEHLEDKRIIVFREYRFRTIDHWILPDGSLKQFGFIHFLVDCWKDFQCRSFFWHEDDEVHRRYSLQCYECDRVQPKPEFIRVLYSGQDIGDNVIDEIGRLQRLPLNTTTGLDGKHNSQLYSGLLEYRTMRDADPKKKYINEAVHALRCLLGGFIYNPLPPYKPDRGLIELPWEKRRW